MACDPQKPMNFQYFAFARRRQPRSKEDNRGQIIAPRKRPQICEKTTNKSSFLRSRLGRPKNDLLEPPRGPPREGEMRPKMGPRRAKRTPRWSQEPSFQFSNSSFPRAPFRGRLGAQDAPGGLQRTLGGAKFDLWGSFWDPRASIFMTLSGAGGAIL